MPGRAIAGAIIEIVLKEVVGPCVVGVIGLMLQDSFKAITGSQEEEAKQPEPEQLEMQQQPREPSMQFISDVTIPDRSAVPAGAMLDKRWLVRNDSAHGISWPAGSKVVFVRGDRALSDGDEFPLNENELPEPGQQTEVSARLRAPATQGRYSAIFRLADKEGNYFGVRLYVDLFVREDASTGSTNGDTADSSSSNETSASGAAPTYADVAAVGTAAVAASASSASAVSVEGVPRQRRPSPEPSAPEAEIEGQAHPIASAPELEEAESNQRAEGQAASAERRT